MIAESRGPRWPTNRTGGPTIDTIEDVIAEDTWEEREGDRRRLIVGRPQIIPADAGKSAPTWYWPVYIESITDGNRPVYGAGPVDALMNAMTVVHQLFDAFHARARDP